MLAFQHSFCAMMNWSVRWSGNEFLCKCGQSNAEIAMHEMQKNAKMQSVQVWIADGYETRKE